MSASHAADPPARRRRTPQAGLPPPPTPRRIADQPEDEKDSVQAIGNGLPLAAPSRKAAKDSA
jgi:hypothetical protein